MLRFKLFAVILMLIVAQWCVGASIFRFKSASKKPLHEDSSSSSHGYSNLSDDKETCAICLDHIDSTLNQQAPNKAISDSFPCGHGKEFHSACFKTYLKSSSGELPCPLCRQPLTLSTQYKEILRLAGTQNEHIIDSVSRFPVNLTGMVRRWPKIQEIGFGSIKCKGVDNLLVITCAHLVFNDPKIKDVVSPIMARYEADPKGFLNAQMKRNSQELYRLRNFFVYIDVDSYTLYIHDAYKRSLNSQSGEGYSKKLEHLAASIPRASHHAVIQEMSRFPELTHYRRSVIFYGESRMGTIEDAMRLLCVPFLNLDAVKQTLQDVNDEFVHTRPNVKNFLQSHYSNLVEFKNMAPFNAPHDTIEHYAQEVMNVFIASNDASKKLLSLNTGAGLIEGNFNENIALMYGHCHVLHHKMQTTPARDITFYTAIKYSVNPHLLTHEKEGWIYAIQTQLRSRGCKPSTRFYGAPLLKVLIPPGLSSSAQALSEMLQAKTKVPRNILSGVLPFVGIEQENGHAEDILDALGGETNEYPNFWLVDLFLRLLLQFLEFLSYFKEM